MDRMRAPTEFGFTTAPYLPPERPRPLWRTLLVAALFALIPIVGPGLSAVYVDRRRIPSTFTFPAALRTAIVQIVAVIILGVILWLIASLLLGVDVHLDVGLTRG